MFHNLAIPNYVTAAGYVLSISEQDGIEGVCVRNKMARKSFRNACLFQPRRRLSSPEDFIQFSHSESFKTRTVLTLESYLFLRHKPTAGSPLSLQ
jgi:hypothetical protein